MFEKGKSGNPGGRPKDPLITEIRRKALAVCPEVIDRFIKIIRTGEDKHAIAAGNSLLDRGIGKPLQSADIESGQIKVIVVNRDGVLDVVRDDGPQ